MVHRTVTEYIRAGVAAVHARQLADSDIVIIARTDALAMLGYDQAISRLKAASQLGTDVAFLEGITSKE